MNSIIENPGPFLGYAAALGLVVRTVIVPLLKKLGLFRDLPSPLQTVILAVLALLAGFLERYAIDGSPVEALVAAITSFAAAQASYGVTAPFFEKKSAISATPPKTVATAARTRTRRPPVQGPPAA